ncbi:MAG TPA: tripartite tricarboxylate transporter substrate-binding protein [Paenalcaligenes sp.]|nr:tripartite tricarboxylate transporter substrate-binding protein [Paenalcaligenes sp.]
MIAASTGEIDFTIVEYSAALSLVESGKLKLLAMTTDERFHAEPDKPTLQELGYGDFLQVAWWGEFQEAEINREVGLVKRFNIPQI